MNNYQCYSYGIKAISNILKAKRPINPDTFFSELFYLWDVYSEEEIAKIVKREEDNNELF